ncbi:hypothetical protein GAU_1421 [Gemmatimonas aurantiaca T-27]|uniref:Cell division protein FtsL n=1 Tax=Gemmatimonas aurantiaca (strain DSM 14586 / JCM 11422 / NBRC 100505 / T-27) TaxID=379066 RepID=C1A8A3_GEMAT|nr:hypothetical protein GAU_1421 [Gemmatimonas aurantiaca T-27]
MMARARRTKSTLKGRSIVAISLGLFVAVTAIVVWRRSVGVGTARDMQRMEAERRALRSERITLENELRRAMGRRQVVQEAERRLGMHVATEAQTRFLAEGARSATPTDSGTP